MIWRVCRNRASVELGSGRGGGGKRTSQASPTLYLPLPGGGEGSFSINETRVVVLAPKWWRGIVCSDGTKIVTPKNAFRILRSSVEELVQGRKRAWCFRSPACR